VYNCPSRAGLKARASSFATWLDDIPAMAVSGRKPLHLQIKGASDVAYCRG
jgi:hypothetical protein